MGERTAHEPGTFSWTDLATPDQEAAKAFYQPLFDWDCEDAPVGDGLYYSMMRIGGRAVAAISAQPASMRELGAPPAWNSYVTVEDADAAAARAEEVGGAVLAEPFEVLDAGRMAVLQDPQGAVFMIWQPRESIGAELVNAPGALTLNQLNTSDPEVAGRFYSELFGWEVAELEGTGQPYWSIRNGETLNGGMTSLPPGAPAPPHWLVYFAVERLEDTLAQVRDGGGQVVVEPIDVPAGRIAVAQDPQGAYFALWEGELDP